MAIPRGGDLCRTCAWRRSRPFCSDTTLGEYGSSYSKYKVGIFFFKRFVVILGVMCCSVVNEPLESISLDLGFAGNTMEEGNGDCKQSVQVSIPFARVHFTRSMFLTLYTLSSRGCCLSCLATKCH